MTKALLQQARDALTIPGFNCVSGYEMDQVIEAILAIDAELAKPEQQPVAWMAGLPKDATHYHCSPPWPTEGMGGFDVVIDVFKYTDGVMYVWDSDPEDKHWRLVSRAYKKAPEVLPLYQDLPSEPELSKPGILYIGFNGDEVRGYTAKELKAAVLQEREDCAAICDIQIASGQLSSLEIYRAHLIADEIRNQGEYK